MNELNMVIYNPDVISCLANLSSDEVFTPPSIVKLMLDNLPDELFHDPNTKFLDPACKTGVFLREIAKRLIEGLKDIIPNRQERIDHILHDQLFGIANTELTSLISRRSLYCSKYPNGYYSISHFDNTVGNIDYHRIQHTWSDGNCIYCGANEKEYNRDISLESYAYEFIHNSCERKIANMKFDVIISNPPYQLSTGGSGRQAKPLYNIFIQQAKKLNPRYLSMIIPSRWFAGGFGLNEFRQEMLNDRHITKLVDYPNAADVFSGVDIAGGVCYFLWERERQDDCEITSVFQNERIIDKRPLNEFKTLIRDNKAISIVRKVFSIEKPKKTLEDTVSPQKPFGLPTNYKPTNTGVPCWFIQRVGLKYADPHDVIDMTGVLDKWKLLVPKAPIAGQTDFTKPVGFYYEGNTRIAKPGECCTESWIVAGAFESEAETVNFKSYLFTKTVRFLLLQTVVSQDVLRNKFCFIPALNEYKEYFTDELLVKRWNITKEEWKYIDSRIHNYGVDDIKEEN
jgi:site-specific DNA-methyltransferase (adenine-specific)